MQLKTRNQLYQYFKSDFEDEVFAQLIFKSISDQELAKMFGLSILRKGYFY